MKFKERDTSKPAEQQGIFRKFQVSRVDGSDVVGGKHFGCRYFVLDMDHDAHAPAALRAYADSCASTHPELAADLRREFGEAERTTAPTTTPDTSQDWAKLDGAVAWHLIERHADSWSEVGNMMESWLAARMAAAPAPIQQASTVPLFDRKLADLQQRGYEVIGRILHKNGEYALFDSSCRWLTQPQYWRLMHEQDGLLFATTPALAGSQVQAVGDAVDAARYRWLRDQDIHSQVGRFTPYAVQVIQGQVNKMLDGKELDAACDAAIREQQT